MKTNLLTSSSSSAGNHLALGLFSSRRALEALFGLEEADRTKSSLEAGVSISAQIPDVTGMIQFDFIYII